MANNDILAAIANRYEMYDDGAFTCVDISWGDWKHDHIYADIKMREAGYFPVSEEVTEEDGSDCYSAIHYYIKEV